MSAQWNRPSTALRMLLAAAGISVLSASGCSRGPEAELLRARDELYEKRPRRALAAYRSALDELEEDRSPGSAVLKARALKAAADIYYLELGEPKEALAVYRELTEQFPEAPETLEGRLRIAEILRVHQRDLRGAIGALTAAIDRNAPQSAELQYEVSKLYFELGNYPQSVVEAERVVARYEASAWVDDALFLKAQALGMLEAAVERSAAGFRELLEREPDSPLRTHALFELGKLEAAAGRPEQAIELWVESLEQHPDPVMVQQAISRARRRLVETTPARVLRDPDRAYRQPRSSFEAVRPARR